MTNKILGVLRYHSLQHELVANGIGEVGGITWDASAHKCREVYSTVLTGHTIG